MTKNNKRKTEVKKRDRAAVVDTLLAAMEDKMSSDDPKFTVADYIRLLQLRREIAEEAPTAIEVTWVETLQQDRADQVA